MAIKFLNTIAVDTNVLYVDASSNNVGIGTTSPSTKLDVNGITTGRGFRTYQANTNYSLISRDSAGNAPLYVQSANASTNQNIARFNYGSANANQGQNVLTVAKDNSYFVNTNVGIGTTSPTQKLQVNGFIALQNGGYIANNINNKMFFHNSGGTFTTGYFSNLAIGGTYQATVPSNGLYVQGNVGIGTTSPSSLLHLLGNSAAIRIEESGGAQVRMAAGGSTGYIGTYTNHALQFLIDANTAMYINTNRKVGIGTTDPNRDLHIKKSNSGGQVRAEVFNTSNTANSNGIISIYSGGASGGDPFLHWKIDAVQDWSMGIDNSDSDKLKISKNFGPGLNDYLTLDTSGNVGIGTTSPASKLDVQGGMSQFSTTLTNNEDWENSPISINERGQVGSTQSADKYAPNLNFHWGGRTSKSLWLNSTGVLHFGEYSSAGIPDATGTFSVNTIALAGTGRITGVDTVSAGTDATSKIYVDNAITTATGAYLPLTAGSSYPLTDTLHIDSSSSGGNQAITFERSGQETYNLTHGTSGLYFTHPNSSALLLGLTQGGDITVLNSSSSEYVRFDQSSQSVGIGTTSPAGKLTITDGGFTTAYNSIKGLFFDNSNITSGDENFGAGIEFGKLGSGGNLYKKAAIVPVQSGTDSDQMGISFFVANTPTQASPVIEAMRVDYGGNVGIGTTSPQGKLHIKTGSGGTYNPNTNHDDVTIEGSGNIGLQLFSPNSSYQYIAFGDPDSVNAGYLRYYHGANEMVFRTSNSDKMVINSSGNVGIGTTSPGAKLEVNSGTTNVTSHFISSDNQAWISIQDSGSGTYGALIGTDSDAGNDFAIANASAVKTFVINSGNVGIGTTSPSYALDVKKDAASILNLYRPNSSTAAVSDLDFSFNTANATESVYARIRADVETNTDSAQGGDLSFHTANSGTVSEKLRITQEGNVGIGTTSPDSEMHISRGASRIRLTNDSNQTWQIGTDNVSNGFLSIKDITDSRDVLILTGDGNVGIGTTSPYGKLNVIPSSNPTTPSAANQIVVGESSANSQYNLRIGYFLEGGAYKGSIQAISGNTPNTLILNGDGGNVGIGTTSPANKLAVQSSFTTSASNSFVEINSGHEASGGGDITGEAGLLFKQAGSGNVLRNAGSIVSGREGNYSADSLADSYLTFSTAQNNVNAERMRIDSSGKVGIGTTSPQQKLQVASPSATSVVLGTSYLSTNNNNFFEVGINANDGYLNLKNSGVSTTIHIDSDGDSYFNGGNVGIGTTSPAGKLEINGGTGVATSGGTLIVRQDGDTSNDGIALTSSNSISHRMFKNAGGTFLMGPSTNSDAFALDLNGNVGIGTTSPGYTLDVNGTLHSSNITLADGIYHEGDTNTYINFLSDQIQMATAGSVRAYINSLGNVGIGTTSPGEKLQVNGAIKIPYSSTNTNFFIQNNDSIGFGKMTPFDNSGFYSFDTNYTSNGGYKFKYNGSEKLRIDHNGNVGIGTTSPAYKLEVDGTFSSNAIWTTASSVTEWGSGTTAYGTLTWDIGYAKIFANSGNQLQFAAGGASTDMTIDTNGNVGIGTTSPASQLGSTKVLDISSTGNGEIILDHTDAGVSSDIGLYSWNRNNDHLAHIKASCDGATDSAFISFHTQATGGSFTNAASNERMRIKSNGRVGIGTTNPGYELDVNGTIRATGDVIAYSDIRIKENIKNIDNALEKVNKLRGVEFNKIGSEEKSIGVIAQEIEKILPEVVKEDEKGMKSVAYGNIVGVLIEAVKDQQKQIDELKSIINGGTK